jgi:hypothetical protein
MHIFSGLIYEQAWVMYPSSIDPHDMIVITAQIPVETLNGFAKGLPLIQKFSVTQMRIPIFVLGQAWKDSLFLSVLRDIIKEGLELGRTRLKSS